MKTDNKIWKYPCENIDKVSIEKKKPDTKLKMKLNWFDGPSGSNLIGQKYLP